RRRSWRAGGTNVQFGAPPLVRCRRAPLLRLKQRLFGSRPLALGVRCFRRLRQGNWIARTNRNGRGGHGPEAAALWRLPAGNERKACARKTLELLAQAAIFLGHLRPGFRRLPRVRELFQIVRGIIPLPPRRLIVPEILAR